MKTTQVVTDIAAPVEIVWAELCAVSEYAEWNPFITTFRGELVEGSRLEVRIVPPGGRAMTFHPTITEVHEGESLEWLGRLGAARPLRTDGIRSTWRRSGTAGRA
jgi:hypothetical protein